MFVVITETLVSIETFVFLSICWLNEKEDILIFSLSTATGSLISVENPNSPIREIHETDSSAIARGLVDQASYRDAAGPSTSSHSRNLASSSNSNSAAVRNGEEKTVGRVDKLKKYILCFKQF